jgi:hypothetical protein
MARTARAIFALVLPLLPLLPLSAALAGVTDPDDLDDVAANAPGLIEHCDEVIAARVFADIFDCGDELFDTAFTAVDGVGANFGTGMRFTRTPRFDLDRYAAIKPTRNGGPNAQSCADCHPGAALGGAGDGPGLAVMNNVQDVVGARGIADPKNFLQRNPPHLFSPGAIQLLAEEITSDLLGIRSSAVAKACAGKTPVTSRLVSKGIDYGSITVSPDGCPNAKVDTSRVKGVDPDLVVKPFGWKGVVAGLRLFNAAAFHNELGMTPTEFAGPGVDSDFDGVSDEILVEDVSAMTVYLAAQPRPTTLLELDGLRRGLLQSGVRAARDTVQRFGFPSLTAEQRTQIQRGDAKFSQIGCNECHIPTLETRGRIFAEPSKLDGFRFDLGVDPAVKQMVDPARPLTFDLTRDQPDNVVTVGQQVAFRLGSLVAKQGGGAIVRPFADFRRHDMGPKLAESIDQPEPANPRVVVPKQFFLTEPLWGVGGSAPYLHDGRASTIEEAIIEHGGEAQASRDRFRGLSKADQDDVLAFLNNLVLFFPDLE